MFAPSPQEEGVCNVIQYAQKHPLTRRKLQAQAREKAQAASRGLRFYTVCQSMEKPGVGSGSGVGLGVMPT